MSAVETIPTAPPFLLLLNNSAMVSIFGSSNELGDYIKILLVSPFLCLQELTLSTQTFKADTVLFFPVNKAVAEFAESVMNESMECGIWLGDTSSGSEQLVVIIAQLQHTYIPLASIWSNCIKLWYRPLTVLWPMRRAAVIIDWVIPVITVWIRMQGISKLCVFSYHHQWRTIRSSLGVSSRQYGRPNLQLSWSYHSKSKSPCIHLAVNEGRLWVSCSALLVLTSFHTCDIDTYRCNSLILWFCLRN